ncbi:MAG TPA: FkbM family methyltransferase [Acidimicrobiales bacterium]|jgi:FkbM family methyltransferase|nr:FkbM family methyltransferase [Acidimicrobiales bacterium]
MHATSGSGRADPLAGILRSAGAFVARRDRPFIGRGYVQLLTRALPGREIEITDRSGHRQVIDTRDQMGANALAGRYRLPTEVVGRVRPGDWVIDCGANIGIITSQLCAAVGPAGQVWACEPVPANVARLERLKAANNLDQLRIVASAIGSEPGTATIGLPPSGRSGWASMTKSFGVTERVEIAVDTLDRLAAAATLAARLSLVKIDVEGFESEVLVGGEHLFTTQRPLIYCEFNDVLLCDRGQSSMVLLDRFGSLGYRPTATSAPLVARMAGRVVNLLMEPEGVR